MEKIRYLNFQIFLLLLTLIILTADIIVNTLISIGYFTWIDTRFFVEINTRSTNCGILVLVILYLHSTVEFGKVFKNYRLLGLIRFRMILIMSFSYFFLMRMFSMINKSIFTSEKIEVIDVIIASFFASYCVFASYREYYRMHKQVIELRKELRTQT